MSKTAMECILTWAKECWPHFDWMPYSYGHFYKIADREQIQVIIDSKPSLDIELDSVPLSNDKHIMINACEDIPEGDSLVCTFAKLFHYYYLNNNAFQNFHFCLNPEDTEYGEVCAAAGFLAVAPCRMVLEDLRNGVDLCQKYQLSPRFAQQRTKLILDHLRRQESQRGHDELMQEPLKTSIALCEDYLGKLENMLNSVEASS